MNMELPAVTAPDRSGARSRKSEYVATLRESLQDMSWSDFVEQAAHHSDPIITARRKEILETVTPAEFFSRLSESLLGQAGEFPTFRGSVFEQLANAELHDAENNSALANFILECLRDPARLGLGSLQFENPDHLGVVVDTEKNVAYITGMYEVKLGKLGKRGAKQLAAFYSNIAKISDAMNQQLQRIKSSYGLSMIPDGGIELRPVDSIEKFVVVPLPLSQNSKRQHRNKESRLNERGWGMFTSVFALGSIEKITAYMMNYFDTHKKEIRETKKQQLQ